MKVCHYLVVDSTKIGGGIATSAKQQRKALDRAGVDWTDDPSEYYDVLHLNTYSPFALFQMFRAKLNGKKVVFHAHTTVKDFKGSFKFSHLLAPLYRFFTSTIYNSSDLLVAPSEYAREILSEQGVSTPVEVLTNGFDDEKLEGFEDLEQKVRKKYNLNGFTVVNLAGAFERKGVDTFIKAGEELEELNFLWFGKIPSLLPRETKKMIENSPENVHFTGFVEDPREAFAAGDLFFFPSREETQGISVLEAAYCGMPIVVRDIPALRGWLDAGENCLKAGTDPELIKKIEELSENEEKRNRLAEGAKKESEKHRLIKVGEELSKIYEKVLE